MSDSGILLRHEVDPRRRIVRDRRAKECRDHFVGPGVKIRNRRDYEEQEHLKKVKKYMIKGRAVGPGRKVYDVYRVEGTKLPMLVAEGFIWPEEAVLYVREADLGRFSVGFGGFRGSYDKKGGLLVPSRAIDVIKALPEGSKKV